MIYPWIRLYTECRTDAKLRSLTSEQFRAWFALLCFAADQPKRGTIRGFSLYVVAVETCNGDCNALVTTCNALHSLRIVTCDFSDENSVEIAFINFEKRQQGADPKAKETKEQVRARVSKWRENKKLHECNGDVTTCNDDVTPNVTVDIDREEEKKEENPLTPLEGGTPSKPKASRTKKKPVTPADLPSPPDWLPTKAWAELVEHRNSIGKPVTPLAATKMFSRLDELQGEGHSPVAVIDAVIANRWSGIYAPKDGSRPKPVKPPEPVPVNYIDPEDSADYDRLQAIALRKADERRAAQKAKGYTP